MRFTHVQKSVTFMTVNSVMAVILRYSTEYRSVGANYVKVVEDRPILFTTEM